MTTRTTMLMMWRSSVMSWSRMNSMLMTLGVVIMMTPGPIFGSIGDLNDYCVSETFHAVCPDNQVIVMEEAYYGRMRIGRCVQTDFGYVGCSSNVLYLMDRKCSGRQECSLTMPDPELEVAGDCNREFKLYLEARYTCMSVISASQRCSASSHLQLSSPSGYLSSLVTEKTGCGDDSSPWVIEAKPGQNINFTLLDFNAPPGEDQIVQSPRCHIYAVITETAKEERIRVCGRQLREQHVYTSVTGSVKVTIISPVERAHFLLKYQVYGCQDPILPGKMWMTREDNIATIGCNGRKRQPIWQMICQDGVWVGGFGNCTGVGGASADKQSDVMATILKLPIEVALVIIVAVAFVVGILIFVIGFVVIRSRRAKFLRQRPRQAILLRKSEAQSPVSQPTKYPPSFPTGASNENKYSGSNDTLSANENEYAYVWDTPQPPSENQENESLDKRRNHSDPGIHQYQCATHAHQPGTGTGIYEKRIVSPEERRYFEGECPPQYFELDPSDPSRGHRQRNIPT